MAAKTKTPEWEWLSLLDIDGPFLSRAALKSYYPSGLPKPDASVDDVNATFAEEFTRWSSAWSASPECYRAARDRWVAVVLRTLLDWSEDLELEPRGLEAASPNGAVVVSPWAALDGDGSAPAALVTLVDRTEDLRAIGTDGWAANAIDRMAVLLRETGATIGIVTDGRWWALVSAAKDIATASGVWDALLWREERPSRDSFLALASFASIAGGQPEKRLSLIFAESVASAEQITEALGDQVRRAVELVLQSMSDTHVRALAEGGASPLPQDGRLVYEGAVTMLMRIVFLLFAEERGLLPEHDLYRSAYAIAGIREELQREATATSAEALDHSWEAWHRLLAASNAVYGGASFEDMRMPAYGGSLFDPDRFPWLQAIDLQGRLQVRLTDRAMLAVLRAVQTIEDGAMQLSFRDLDVEQIGYVYEGLLSYSAEYVPEVTVGLAGKSGYEPEVSLAALEALAASAATAADFAARLVEHLKKTQEKSVPRTAKQIMKAFDSVDRDAAANARTHLRYVLLGDDELAARLEPFHSLIRNDLRGFPYVVPANGLVMAESPQRATTGTHYTPRSLAEKVVLHALEPLVYSPGPLDTDDSRAWKLKSSAEILDLKVADIAAGSGAFLVAAARYLADRLIEARGEEGLNASDESSLRRWAVREVVARCLYGADINGVAVEMCKLSLWLISMDPGKPFSFVDDRVFHGNSLLGVATEAQLKTQHIFPERRVAQTQLRWFDVDNDLEVAARLRRELASGQVNDADPVRSTRAKRALLAQATNITSKLREVADGIVAAGLLEAGKPGPKLEERYDELADALSRAYPVDGTNGDRADLDAIISAGLTSTVDKGGGRWKPLHWIIEAPDVIQGRGGFDAIVGNPPFRGGLKISDDVGSNVREWYVNVVACGRKGSADLVAYFFLRATDLVNRNRGRIGLLGTNTLAQGDTREVGLEQLLAWGANIDRAIQSAPWPRKAAVHFAAVWLGWSRSKVVISDGLKVDRINSLLEPARTGETEPRGLAENDDTVFIGSYVLGQGFVISPEEARQFIDENPRNAEVLFPYIGGEDLSSRPDASAWRWIINFGSRTEHEARMFAGPFHRVEQTVKPARAHLIGRNPTGTDRGRNWWRYGRRADGLYRAIDGLGHAFAITLTCNALSPLRVSTDQVIDQTAPVFASESFAFLAIVSSEPHRLWVLKYGSTFGSGARYSLREGFATFPRPHETPQLAELGTRLDRQRREIMLRRGLGLTSLYNAINSAGVTNDPDVNALRTLQENIDNATVEAYGWTDIHLDHGFHTYRQMNRWTVSPAARIEIFERLLTENQRRAAIETRAKPGKSNRNTSFAVSEQPEGAMF